MSLVYLKTSSEEELLTALKACGWAWEDQYVLDENGNPTDTIFMNAGIKYVDSSHRLDIVGAVFTATGNTFTIDNGEGGTEEIDEIIPVDGWHANVELNGIDLPEELSAFVIDAPATPFRSFT
jgi:hypothetical protein